MYKYIPFVCCCFFSWCLQSQDSLSLPIDGAVPDSLIQKDKNPIDKSTPLEVLFYPIDINTIMGDKGAPVANDTFNLAELSFRLGFSINLKSAPIEEAFVTVGTTVNGTELLNKSFKAKDTPSATYPFGMIQNANTLNENTNKNADENADENRVTFILRDLPQPTRVYIKLNYIDIEGKEFGPFVYDAIE